MSGHTRGPVTLLHHPRDADCKARRTEAAYQVPTQAVGTASVLSRSAMAAWVRPPRLSATTRARTESGRKRGWPPGPSPKPDAGQPATMGTGG